MSTDTITSDVPTGVTLSSGGTYGNPVTVASRVTVSGTYAITVQGPWTVENQGTVSGTSRGVFITAAASNYVAAWITNDAGGTITAAGRGVAVGVGNHTGPITLDNAGYISGYQGVVLTGGAITNTATGTIAGGNFGITDVLAAVTIDNAGKIAGNLSDGIHLAHYYGSAPSLIDNETGGTIASRFNNGIYIAQSYATVENAGTIGGFYTDGVKVHAVSASIENSGSIYGGTDGVFLGGTNATLENSGAISGTQHAAYLDASASNRLILGPGAIFDGAVIANAGAANTIELAGTSTGTLTGLGSHYQNFQTVTIDTGATWDIAGTVAGFSGTTIAGFGNHDRLDLTDLNFSAGDTVTLDSGSDLLSIKDTGGTVLATIQLDVGVAGDLFKLVSDGHGGTFAEESDYTPCYCRGTRIRTPRGDVAVEDLRIGDLITTAAGEALPLKWIGRRAYSEWLAVGNAKVQPILFKAGALADGVPVRDLYVSPEHAMFLDGMLVPARRLENGASIVKMSGMEAVAYFHLEFDRQAVILAEGAPAESFVDDDSRMLFHNGDEYCRLYPDEPPRRPEFCAPRVENGAALEMLRLRLQARARTGADRKAEPATAGRGYLDRVTHTAIEGWAARDGSAPEEGPVRLAILINGAVIGETLANRRRADLKAAGMGDCAFRFTLPRPLSSRLTHRVEVRRESDWTLLLGGPVTLNPHAPKAAA
jgi:hypothetical protein